MDTVVKLLLLYFYATSVFVNSKVSDSSEEEEAESEESNPVTADEGKKPDIYEFLYKRMKQDVIPLKNKLNPDPYMIPGPQEPLPGRSHPGNYWPVFPFQNQFSGGLDLDPSISRHIGGDLNLAVPSWGMLDIYGRFFNRISDTTTKFGYLNYPVNMMDLEPEDFVKLMSDPGLHWNRNVQPRLPLGKLAKSYVPLNCKPPMCNPYHAAFGLGVEHDFGGSDGVEGDIDVPIPISKGLAYRFPLSGKVYYHRDNITVSYGHQLSPIEPFSSLFDYQKYRDPRLRIPRTKREIQYSQSSKVWNNEPAARTFKDYLTQPRFMNLQRAARPRTFDFYMPMQTVDYYPPVPYNFHDFIDPYSMPVEMFNEFPFGYNFPNMEMIPMQDPHINWQQMANQLDNMLYFSRKVQYFDENGREQPSVEVAVEQQPYSLSDSRLFQQLMFSADCGCGEKAGKLMKKQIEYRQEESPVEDATDSTIKQQITQTPHGAHLQTPWTFAMQNIQNVANLRSAQMISPFNRKQSPKNWQMKGNWKKRRWNWWRQRREQWRRRRMMAKRRRMIQRRRRSFITTN